MVALNSSVNGSKEGKTDVDQRRVAGTGHAIAQVDINQTVDAKHALSLFPIDAQRRLIAARIITEAISAGKLDMMCRTIVTEVNAKPVKMKPPTETSKLIKDIEHAAGKLFCVSKSEIPSKRYTPTARAPFVTQNWKESIFVVEDPKIHGILTRPDGRIYVRLGDRSVFYGVRFREDQVKALVDVFRAGDSVYSPLPDEVKVGKRYDYEALIPSLLASAKNGTLEKEFGSFEKYGTKARLEEALMDAIYGYSEGQARRKATELIKLNEQAKTAGSTEE